MTEQAVRELEAYLGLRGRITEQLGAARSVEGMGVAGLFIGPSGTGKTLTAQVLARKLGLEAYRLNLSHIVGKYIGETEKDLCRLFEEFDRPEIMLLIDEADVLFGSRDMATSAHDRFAGQTTSHLLQSLERFQGVAILAAHGRTNLDPALMRRARFVVEFHRPGPRERRLLWRKVLAAQTSGRGTALGMIDWDALAAFQLTGGEIARAALAAAFVAQEARAPLEMRHLRDAVKREDP